MMRECCHFRALFGVPRNAKCVRAALRQIIVMSNRMRDAFGLGEERKRRPDHLNGQIVGEGIYDGRNMSRARKRIWRNTPPITPSLLSPSSLLPSVGVVANIYYGGWFRWCCSCYMPVNGKLESHKRVCNLISAWFRECAAMMMVVTHVTRVHDVKACDTNAVDGWMEGWGVGGGRCDGILDGWSVWSFDVIVLDVCFSLRVACGCKTLCVCVWVAHSCGDDDGMSARRVVSVCCLWPMEIWYDWFRVEMWAMKLYLNCGGSSRNPAVWLRI